MNHEYITLVQTLLNFDALDHFRSHLSSFFDVDYSSTPYNFYSQTLLSETRPYNP